ncbi:hypothetical protein NL676_025866 [Syzygium grande]|nr:hypothetical protein NL676_025866 [Syzygium grande]
MEIDDCKIVDEVQPWCRVWGGPGVSPTSEVDARSPVLVRASPSSGLGRFAAGDAQAGAGSFESRAFVGARPAKETADGGQARTPR